MLGKFDVELGESVEVSTTIPETVCKLVCLSRNINAFVAMVDSDGFKLTVDVYVVRLEIMLDIEPSEAGTAARQILCSIFKISFVI